MSFEEKVEKIFKKLYKSQYSEDYKIGKNDNTKDFFLLLKSKYAITDDLIITYVIFGYEYYFSLPESVKKVELSWVISKKMVNRFFERKPFFDNKTQMTIFNALGISKNQLRFIDTKLKSSDFAKINDSEEIIKRFRPFPNTLRGLDYCKERTTMHHPLSEICKLCKTSELCKNEQEVSKKLINLYRKKIK